MYEVGLGDSPMRIARKLNGNPYRYGELLQANPHKSIVYRNGAPTFFSLGLGEKLFVPLGFVGDTGSSKLLSGQSMQAQNGTGRGFPPPLRSPNGRLTLWLQSDSNLVLYDGPDGRGRWLWSSGPAASCNTLTMKTDGNLVLTNAASGAIGWQSGTPGHPGAFLQLQDTGNMVLYDTQGAYWSPGTEGFKRASGTPWYRGKKSDLDEIVDTASDIASYATTVVSLVPGVGTGVAAALAAGLALAKGQNITDALKAGIVNALPGGAVAAAGFDMALKVASGANVGQAALETVRDQLPPGPAQKAFDIGIAVATGEKHQQSGAVQPSTPARASAVIKQAFAAATPLKTPPKTLEPPKRVAAAPTIAAPHGTPPRTLEPPKKVATIITKSTYAPYPKMDVGVGSFWSSSAWRWFVVYENGTPTTQHGPLWLSDNDANVQSANLLASTQGRDAIGDVAQWNWDADAHQWRMVGGGALGTPQHSGRLGACFDMTSVTWGPPITGMSGDMRWAGLSAVNGSGGRSRAVKGPDGRDYLFAMENGELTARTAISI